MSKRWCLEVGGEEELRVWVLEFGVLGFGLRVEGFGLGGGFARQRGASEG
jgi:hypothetical protein